MSLVAEIPHEQYGSALFIRNDAVFESFSTHSNIADLINNQMRSRKTFNPRGWLPFTEALKEMNVPNDLIGNPRRLNITTGSSVGKKWKPTASYAPKKRGGYRDLCKWKMCITIHRIPEVLEVLKD